MKKKIISFFMAGLASVSSMCISSAYAVDAPLIYFKSEENTDIVKISSDDVANGDVTVKIGMYIDDSSNDIASLVFKWRCDSEYVTFRNLLSPVLPFNDETEYTLSDGTSFVTKYIPTCFGKVSNGKYSFQGTFTVPDKPDSTTGHSETAYAAMYQSEMKYPVTWLEGDSDAYMMSDFDAVISQGTPDGLYTIYYLSSEKDNVDDISSEEFEKISHGTYFNNKNKLFLPQTKSITIQVGEMPAMGDVNGDNVVNASDASDVLSSYANFSSGKGHTLEGFKFQAADVNYDGYVDASDASRILEYYANISSGKEDSLENLT